MRLVPRRGIARVLAIVAYVLVVLVLLVALFETINRVLPSNF